MTYIPIDKLAETMGKSLDETARNIKIRLFNGVIRDTRVDTGRLRGNWQTTTGKPAKGEMERHDPVPQYEDGGMSQEDVISIVKGDTIDWLTNNLPYAAVWEMRDGMIDKNVARIERYVKEELAK